MTVRSTTMTLLLSALLIAGAIPAAAAQPVFSDRYSFEYMEEDEELTALCGLEVLVSVQVQGRFTARSDGSIDDSFRERLVYSTSEAELEQFGARNFRGSADVVTVNPDGSTSIQFEVFERGLSVRLKDANGVVIRDAGNITFVVTIVIDAEGDEVVSVEADVKGPHPIFEAQEDGVFIDRFCALLGGDEL
jgi:hypothetical protein